MTDKATCSLNAKFPANLFTFFMTDLRKHVQDMIQPKDLAAGQSEKFT